MKVEKECLAFYEEFSKINKDLFGIFKLTSETSLLNYLKACDKSSVCCKKIIPGMRNIF